MTPDERAMLAFTLRWHPFGGGNEYIFPEFGLFQADFYRRVLALVTSTPTDDLDSTTRALLQDICTSQLSCETHFSYATTNTTTRTDPHPSQATAKRTS